MLKIGEFATLTGISINMLRNYDKIGLLIPEYVDEINSYRYYSECQIIVANRIQILKELGFNLKEILMINHCSDDDILKLIKNKILEKQKEKECIEEQVLRMNQIINDLGIYSDYAFSVKVTTLESWKVVSLRANISKFEDEGALWERFKQKCIENNVKLLNNEYSYAITHNIDLTNKIIDTEVLRIVSEVPAEPKGLKYYELPKSEVAVVSFKGTYSKISDISSYVNKYVKCMGYETSYAPLRKYFVAPNNELDSNNYITEYYYPLKKI
ncbi:MULTISPECIES: MerR family transcriptional regulator [unclassified Clostridium]|uniref:MerR family transcriptional regulator n=1 Tax=unclassified Clostridium TaxID=2614128 RepID=UPI0002978877|nr:MULTISPECIES: MerR family transcriptional regulator [unclassified Clostridium]EKQ54702.1 MAG: putative transcriptional regulator [Clostridium sp. Maddingley MBC34-26]